MIKENQKYLNRFHVVLDALVIYCSFCLVTIFDIYVLFSRIFFLVLVTGDSYGNTRVYFLF